MFTGFTKTQETNGAGISSMKDKGPAGQFCRIANGQRVFVESVDADGGGPASAAFHYIEGPDIGKHGTCLVSTLKLLGKEIPVLQAMES